MTRRFQIGDYPGEGPDLTKLENEMSLCPECGEPMVKRDRQVHAIIDPPQVWTSWRCPEGHSVEARYEDDWLEKTIRVSLRR